MSSMTDPSRQHVNVYSSAKEGWFPAVAILDTGTSDNWISEALVERLSLTPTYGEPVKAVTFNGQTTESRATVEATWYGNGSNQSRHTVFRVQRNASFDVLFGKTLLFTEAILSFNEQALILIARKPDKGRYPFLLYWMVVTNYCTYE